MTIADKINDYYNRHPCLSVNLNELLACMIKEDSSITLVALRGGMRILKDEEFFARGRINQARQGPTYKQIRLGYVSQMQRSKAGPSQSEKDRCSRQDAEEAKESAWERLRYLMLCGPWLLINTRKDRRVV